MRVTTSRTLEDRIAGVNRFMRALSRDATEWEPEHLLLLRDLHVTWLKVQDEAVLGMREHGTTDKQIAEALGITQQAVSKHWPGGGRYVGAAGRYRSN